MRGLRARHPEGRLFAVFEPRSATASRRLHQDEYEKAFGDADVVVLAPVGRPEIATEEKLDVGALAAAMQASGRDAHAPDSHDALLALLVERAAPGDTIALMSNGDFGGVHDRLLAALATRPKQT